MTDQAVFPSHGRLNCSRCFKSPSSVQELGQWRMRNDPGAWGSQSPECVVLGFSKGATQADIYASGNFDDVAFGGAITRKNLTNILHSVGLLQEGETIDQKICAGDKQFHFGSLVRCSLSRYDEKESVKRGHPVYATSGSLITKSFSEIPEIIDQCSNTFLSAIPKSVKVMIVLGVTPAYVRKFQKRMQSMHPSGFRMINEIAYQNDELLWVHLTHPSRGNGTISAWLSGDSRNTSGRKKLLAIEALCSHGIGSS